MANQRTAGALIGYVNILAKTVVNLLYTPMLIRFLGQNDYGVFQMTNSVVQSLSILTMGFDFAYVRFYSQDKAKNQEKEIAKLNGMYLLIFAVMAMICMICGCVLFANVDYFFGKGLNQSERSLAKKLILIMILSVSLSFPSTVFDSYIIVHENFIFQQSRQLFTALAVPILSILALIFGFGATGVALAQVLMSVVLLILNINFAINKLNMQFKFKGLDFSLFKDLAIFSFWIFLNQIFDMVNNNVPSFLLGAMGSAKEVAIFSVALQIRSLFPPISTVLLNVFIPKINIMVAQHESNERLTSLMIKVGRYQLILFVFLYCGFALVGKYFIRFWAGKGFEDAYKMILIMTLPMAFDLIQNTGMTIQRAENRQKARSIAYVITALVDLGICVIFIPKFGYWAASWGYVVSVLLSTGIFMNWYFHFRLGLDMKAFWSKMMPILIVAFCTFIPFELLTYYFPVNNMIYFLGVIFVYTLFYFVIVWYILVSSSERSKIKLALLKIRHKL